MVNVTKTYFPPINSYIKQIERIYENQWLTNRGALVRELEGKISDYLNLSETNNILLMNNGTIPIQIALKLLGNGGEIITTPFSYVATTAAIVWEGCTPVFVDISPDYLTIDEDKIEAAITNKTTCILATHVFGNPCNIEKIEKIASEYNLHVIYDAAHCFGTTYKNKSLFEFGDISTCSFHATKIFHCGEGGAAFVNDNKLFEKVYYSHNFGHNGPLEFHGLGINAKMSELNAAMGLAVLPSMENILSSRKYIVDYYNSNLVFKRFRKIVLRSFTSWNYSYYPIIFHSSESAEIAISMMNEKNIFPRRYFYPSLDTLNYLKSEKMPISNIIAERVICLPLYYGLGDESLLDIVDVLNRIE
jgi:dTDP-4-amino-4,6-dideoxygalactose transaminase